MITKETIDKIFSAIRVEEIVGEYVQLKRAGSNYKGLSPFVDEKTPSFIVSPSKQIWKDFSSGKGGTAISFLMEIEGFSYPEALRYAAKKYGIEIEELKKDLTEEEKKAQTDKDLLYKIHEVANDFFQNQLYETEEGLNIGLSVLAFVKKLSLIPLLGLSSCLYLMTGMSMENWFWFGIWSAVGVCIYFAYGYRHSNLHDKQKTH